MRAICISLPEYPERRERAAAHFESRGLTDLEFFWGLDGETAGLATWHSYELDHPGSGFRIGPELTGQWLSHYMLWAMMTRMHDDAYLVLEDTAALDDDFMDRWQRAMRDVPSDYAFLHLGHGCLAGRQVKHVAGDVYETKDQLRSTYAYVLRRNIAPILLKLLRRCWAPIDVQLALEAFPHLRTYAVVPRIAGQFGVNIPP